MPVTSGGTCLARVCSTLLLFSELANGQSGDQKPQPIAEDELHRGVRWQPPTRGARHRALADSDEPDAGRANAQADGRHSGIGVEYSYETEKARTKDGAGGGPAEKRTCARGRCVRLLKIGASRTRMRVWGDILFTESGIDAGFKISLHIDCFKLERDANKRLVISSVTHWQSTVILH